MLPKKRLIAHVLIRDPAGRVLLCETQFKQDWELPGGIVEPGEPPRVGANREVTEELGLKNAEIFRGRAEQAIGKSDVDVVTARAVSALSGLASLTMPLLKGPGEVLAIKGRSAGEEVEKAAKIIRRLGGKSTRVETVGGDLLDEPTTVVRIVVER